MRRVGSILCTGLLLACALTSRALAADPKVPPGTDPGGIAIALIGEGVDYTDPQIAERLARDGEGEIIGWDLVDGDRFPYAAGTPSTDTPSGTDLARRLLKVYKHARLIPIRVASLEPTTIAKVVALLAKTPARIVAIPAWGTDRAQWELFRQVAEQARGLLLVVSAGDQPALMSAAPTWPSGFRLDNVVSAAPAELHPRRGGSRLEAESAAASVDAWMVAAATTMLPLPSAKTALSPQEAVVLAAGLAACAQHSAPATDGRAAKAALSALARPSKDDPQIEVHDPMCWYGGVRY